MENENRSDALLVEKAIAGDHAAFAVLLNRYRDKIYRLLYFMVHHEADTWDLLQDTCLKAYEGLPKLKNPEIFISWVLKIAVNLAINHVKRKSRWRKCFQALADSVAYHKKAQEPPERVLERAESQAQLQNLIAQLPPKQRSVLVLADIEGYSYKEVAEIVQCRIGTVMSRLFYARNFLRTRLPNWEPVSDSSTVPEFKQTTSASRNHSAESAIGGD